MCVFLSLSTYSVVVFYPHDCSITIHVCMYALQSYEVLANLTSDVKSFEQREEEYEKARARIFNQQPLHGSRSNIAFDLGSAPQRTRSRYCTCSARVVTSTRWHSSHEVEV